MVSLVPKKTAPNLHRIQLHFDILCNIYLQRLLQKDLSLLKVLKLIFFSSISIYFSFIQNQTISVQPLVKIDLNPKNHSYSLSQDFHSFSFLIEAFFSLESNSPSLVWSSSDKVSPSECTSLDFLGLAANEARSLSECSLPLGGG